jgi:hypothetical protein
MTPPAMRIGLLMIVSAALASCRDESVAGPFGLRLRERPGAGSVAAAIRHEALNRPDCPAVPAPSPDWTARTLTRPGGQVPLPRRLEAVTAPTSEVTFFATDMSAGAFVIEAPSLATLELPGDSPLSRSVITTCRVRAGVVESVVHLISQPQLAGPGDSVHLAFLQVAVGGDQAVRAGAFATTRALRDSLVGALLVFQPGAR